MQKTKQKSKKWDREGRAANTTMLTMCHHKLPTTIVTSLN